MIIVEGPDGAGKTTLIQRLCNDYGFEVGERGTKDRDLLYTVTVPDTMRAIRTALMGGKEPPLIWDRLYFSDLVYAPVQQREVAFTRTERRIVTFFLRAAHIPVILCLPRYETVEANVLREDRHEMPAVKENIQRIYRTYANGVINVPHVHYNYEDEYSYDRVANLINNYLYERRERLWTSSIGSN